MPIKSFQGQREQTSKSQAKTLLVEDIMTRNLIVFNPNETIHEVMQKFIKYRISGGPVVDHKGDLIGVISEADCMKEVSESRYFNLPILDKNVSKFMTAEVDTIDASKTIFEAASKFFKTSRRRFPVLDKDKLVGQISRKDIVIATLNMKSNTWRQ
ncbi:MAG: inosine-5-monophosphate dehydrogenase [Flavobacteriales bacterium MED-G15]|nr:MAG: inosine-5-monophosphate dehydrogenase [Flavobacteriales bacterium MED-G15]|tara:strand:+ start:822 stop:1289 length:468 start_codon:yes stop_codon:yes gene_type:complete